MLPKYKGLIFGPQRWSTFGSTCLNLGCKLSNTLRTCCAQWYRPIELMGFRTQDAFVTLSRWPFFYCSFYIFIFFTFFRHLLVVFGGLQGLEASVDADQNLNVTDPSVLFDLYLNTCPGQGSRTIRTEVRACYDIDWTMVVHQGTLFCVQAHALWGQPVSNLESICFNRKPSWCPCRGWGRRSQLLFPVSPVVC